MKAMGTQKARTLARRHASAADDEPQRWMTEKEAEGWDVDASSDDAPRGRRESAFLVALDAERAAWVHAQVEATGLSFSELFAQLIDQHRAERRAARHAS